MALYFSVTQISKVNHPFDDIVIYWVPPVMWTSAYTFSVQKFSGFLMLIYQTKSTFCVWTASSQVCWIQ